MKNQKGFTLIELMIVVAIIGVLSSIGIMSYSTYSAKGERDRGCVMILPEMARDMETYRQVNGTFTTDFKELNKVLKTSKEWAATPTDKTLTHTYSIAAGASKSIISSFKISCTPTKVDAAKLDSTGCGVLTYDNFGRRGVLKLASSKTVDSCWR
ncbi:hypothetical protein MNBD_GAMMA09-1205 [hydrothermal vent metagenome]|uniref:Type IV pilus biogenesis protein PilE n=1 Tax=hydrothermal vent metagenome TaxID=652676 RepID=A0A3B0XTJ9_9ZZZZ